MSSVFDDLRQLKKNLIVHVEVVKSRSDDQHQVLNIEQKNNVDLEFTDATLNNIFTISREFLSDVQLSFLKVLFHIMEEDAFHLQSSVSMTKTSNKKVNFRYADLAEINLLSHTINVINYFFINSGNISLQNKIILFFSAVLHDFGKSKSTVSRIKREFYEIYKTTENEGHWKMSALIFRHLYAEFNQDAFSDGDLMAIHTILFYHHDYTNIDNKSEDLISVIKLIEALEKIDILARKTEANFIMRMKK